MGRAGVDQRDVGAPAATEPVAEFGGEFEPTGAAADDDNAVQRRR
jgi:hypothetical protein